MPDQDDKPPRPALRVASETSEYERKIERGRQEIDYPLRELAANIIRVVRGAGRAYDIGRQCVEVIEAYKRYHEFVERWPADHEITRALSLPDLFDSDLEDDEFDHARAIQRIVRGALQMTASEILAQRLQFAAGQEELYAGVFEIERRRERAQMEMAAREREARVLKRTQQKPRKRK